MVDGIEQFRRGIAAHSDPKYTARPSYRALDVTNVQKTSAGAVESISGFTDDGGAELRVPMGGKAAAVGDRVLVSFDPTAPAGAEFQYIRHVAADHPGAGLVIVDADLPIPTFAAVWHTSSIVANPGRITARASVMFNMLGDKYGPSGYIVSHRYDPGGGYTDWRDSNFIPHSVGGTIGICNLGSDFPPSCVIDVKIRAFFNWTNSSSLASLPQSFVAAADANTPGNAGGLTVSEGTPGLAVLTATGSVDASLFAGWSYEIATSSSGPATATSPPQPGMWVIPSPGTFYARVRPISKSGTYGAYFPVSGWQGPYTIIAPYYPDTTPPPVWTTQPTLVNGSYIDPQNVWRGIVSVTLPGGYSFPADYAYTMIRLQNITTGYTRFERIEGTALGPIAVDMGAGTIKVDAVGFDKTNNRQATFGTQATIVLTQPWLPTGTLTVTTQTKGVGIAILWSGVADALWYEVWRSTSSIGTGATRLYERVEGFGAFDPLLDSAVAPTYYYQVRAFNTAGAGPVSSGWTAGTPGKIDGQNIKLASLTAGLVNGVEAFFQGLTVSGVLLTGGINTGSSTQSRIELRGNALANPNMMRLIERIGGVDIVRSIIDGAGITVYGDPAVGSPANIRMYRHTDGYGRFSAHNIDIMRNLITVDTSGGAALKLIGGSQGDFYIQGVSYNGQTNVGFNQPTNGIDTAFGFTQGSKWIWLNGGNISTRPSIEFGTSSVPNVSLENQSTGNLRVNGGLAVTSDFSAANIATAGYVRATAPVVAGTLTAGNYGSLRVFTATLADTLGAVSYLGERFGFVNNPSQISLIDFFVRGVAGNTGGEVVHRSEFRIDNTGSVGGHLDIGFNGGDPYWAIGRPGVQDIDYNKFTARIQTAGAFFVGGALSKSSGTFEIPHPDPAKTATHLLRHSFVESPDRGGNIYRYTVECFFDNESFAMDLPDYFKHLNVLHGEGEDQFAPQVIVQADDLHWGDGRGNVRTDGTAVDLLLRGAGRYTVIVFATRKDEAAVAGWDNTGGVEPPVLERAQQ